jgi:HK97 gp10 family phage protein
VRQVDGVEALVARIRAIPDKVTESAREFLEAKAQEIVEMMQRLVPKESFALWASIGWTWGDAPEGSMVIGKVKGGKGAGKEYASLAITIYAGGGKAFYGRFQEFGTKNMPANPFFFPAYRAKRASVKSGLTRVIKKAVATP